MTKIRGNRDGPNRRNETYRVGKNKKMPRRELVNEVECGLHQGLDTVKINGQKYVRDNPDKSKSDNVNR